MESETADTELKLTNTTKRLQRLEQDVTSLRDKALNITLSTEQTNQDAASIGKIAEEVKNVSSIDWLIEGHTQFVDQFICVIIKDSVCIQDLDLELRDKYTTVEQLIGQKAGGVADAKKRAESLQQEAKELLLKASDKLQLLKGEKVGNCN